MSGEVCLDEKTVEEGSTHTGKDHVDVVEDKLSVEEISALATSPTSGAIALFVGTTRDNFEGKRVVRLEYEAYMPMAKKKMLETCQLVRSKWSVENIVMVHRLGVVPVGEASIVIAVSSPHRKEALEAVHFAIDHVKATVPVWKKEIYGDDSSSWKQNKECSWSSAHPPS
ncbi:molybdopterin synthase catalytic subunit-like [Babylonia areolata]|uniref:molybdopterin synthase catalytic subunit-like n=1 Tax=Babylonia areolata TaxID=304850 RepID=UPI003FD1BC56